VPVEQPSESIRFRAGSLDDRGVVCSHRKARR
jgi:hypothetical protein